MIYYLISFVYFSEVKLQNFQYGFYNYNLKQAFDFSSTITLLASAAFQINCGASMFVWPLLSEKYICH